MFAWLLLALTPAHALTLDVGRLSPGDDVTFTVQDGPPSGTAWVMASSSLGQGPCAPSAPDVCSGLAGPVVLTAVSLDATGAGARVLTAPADLALTTLWFEAVTQGPPAAASPPVAIDVVDTVPAGLTWVVDTFAEWTLLSRHVEAIDGTVILRSAPLATLAFPHLTRVSGSLTIEDTRASAVSFPVLTRSPATRCEARPLTLRRNLSLTSVHAPLLEQGSLCSEGNGPVAYDLPALTAAFMLSFQSEGRAASPPVDLADLHAPNLQTAVFFDVYYTQLTTLTLPSLVSVAAPFQVWHNDLLTTLDLPHLVATPLFVVRDNPSLSTCEVDAVALDAAWTTSQVECRDNLTDGSCQAYCL